jgi:transcriptional regulator with XRE-family HTH domain
MRFTGRLKNLSNTAHGPSIANLVCRANKDCDDTQNLFAYREAMAQKNSISRRARAEFARLIREARERKRPKLSQEAVADELGITRQGYAHYELAGALPPIDVFANLCNLLELDIPPLLSLLGLNPRDDPKPAAVSHLTPLDPELSYLVRLWRTFDIEDRRFVIQAAEWCLKKQGVSLKSFHDFEGDPKPERA